MSKFGISAVTSQFGGVADNDLRQQRKENYMLGGTQAFAGGIGLGSAGTAAFSALQLAAMGTVAASIALPVAAAVAVGCAAFGIHAFMKARKTLNQADLMSDELNERKATRAAPRPGVSPA